MKWIDNKKFLATYLTVVNVHRRKNNLPCYGKLVCSHLEDTTCQYKACPKAGCILFGVVSIAKEIVKDLLSAAQVNSKLKDQPSRDAKGRKNDSYWRKRIATYLLYVMQEVKWFQFLKEKKDNILYQCGYGNISLSTVLGVTKKDALAPLPYWIVIPKMSRTQLIFLVRDLHIKLPTKCSTTRNALCTEVLRTYKEWEKALNDKNSTNAEMKAVFGTVVPLSEYVSIEAKAIIRTKIIPLKQGDEIILNWITTDGKGFCPIRKQIPGPARHRLLITSWLHKCSLLHEQSDTDTRPTRVFSDTDCRTHALHLRRDSGEDNLTLCKQLGWKVPAPVADTGSTVYNRCDAVVTGNEYNSMFISFLQHQYEGHVTAKAGINMATVFESARMNWKQLLKINKADEKNQFIDEKKIKLFVEEKVFEQLGKVECRLEQIENTLRHIRDKVVLDTTYLAGEIASSVIESLRSATDAGQVVVSKIQKRKTRTTQSKTESGGEESVLKIKKARV